MDKYTGFIGLGNIGAPMARNLLRTLGRLAVCNRSQEICRTFAAEGAEVCPAPGDLAERADIVFLALPGPAEVRQVAAGPGGLLERGRPGLCILDCSTVSPGLSRELAALAEARGIRYVDAPVSGGVAGARKGTLSLMLGASREELENWGVLPCLEAVGTTFHYIGQRGGGSAVKLINNFMAFAAQAVNGEALAMADRLGIPAETFFDVVSSGTGANFMLRSKRSKVESGDLEPGFALKLALKDLELAGELCREQDLPNPMLDLALRYYRRAAELGCGDKDCSAVIQTIRQGAR